MSTSRVLRNASMLGVAQAVSMAAGFVSVAWLARMLGPEAYGILGFGTAFVSYFALVIVFGTDSYGMREIASAPARTGRLVSRIFGLRLILLIAVGAVYLAIVALLDRPRDVTVVMIIQVIGLLSAAATVDFLFQGVQRMGPMAARQSGAALLGLAAVLILVRGPGDVFVAAAIPFSAMLISAVLLAFVAHRQVAPLQVSFDRAALAEIVRASAPITLAGLMVLVYMNVDIVMLGFMRPAEEVGVYAGMARLFVLSLLAGHIVTAAFAPALAAAMPDADAMRAAYYRHIRIAVFLGTPICAAIIAFPGWVVLTVFGEKFLDGVPVLMILAIAALISYAGMAGLTALISWRDQTAQMYILGGGAAANLALNFWLIPAHGAMGAAIATLLAQVLMFLCLLYRIRSRFGFFGMAWPAAMVGCGFLAFAAARIAYRELVGVEDIWPVWALLPALALAGAAIYVIFAVATGTVRRADLTGVLYVLQKRDEVHETDDQQDRKDDR